MKLKRGHRMDVAIELAPLVDVVFLLLIFFMVSTTFVDEARLSIELPGANETTPADTEEPLTVVVTQSAKYRLSNAPGEMDEPALRRALASAASKHPDMPLVLVGDAKAPHYAVVSVMDIARELQITSLRIATTTAK